MRNRGEIEKMREIQGEKRGEIEIARKSSGTEMPMGKKRERIRYRLGESNGRISR